MVSDASTEYLGDREILLGEAARAYLDLWWAFEGRWGQAIETLKEEQRARRTLCADCHFLLESHLGKQRTFPASGWVDGFYPNRIAVTARDSLDIPGTFLWVEGQEKWWLEPGFASVELQPGTRIAQTYALRFGDAAKGLAKRPFARRRAEIWVAPKEWLFAFDGPSHTLH
jgi:hypothetical protein